MEAGSPSRHRSWADEVEDEPPSPWSPGAASEHLLGRGPEGKVALSDSKEYSECESKELPPPLEEVMGKGKATAEPAKRKRRARRHRHARRRPAAFMADARRSDLRHSPPSVRPHPPRPTHPARTRGPPDQKEIGITFESLTIQRNRNTCNQ